MPPAHQNDAPGAVFILFFTVAESIVILSISEGSRMVTLFVLFTGFFTAPRFRMTGERERAVGGAGPYNAVSVGL